MEIRAINENPDITVDELMLENPTFYDLLTDLCGKKSLEGLELFREGQGNIHTARFKTYGYGVILTADVPQEKQEGYLYAIAQPIYENEMNDSQEIIQLCEGPLNFDTLYCIKDTLIELIILK